MLISVGLLNVDYLTGCSELKIRRNIKVISIVSLPQYGSCYFQYIVSLTMTIAGIQGRNIKSTWDLRAFKESLVQSGNGKF